METKVTTLKRMRLTNFKPFVERTFEFGHNTVIRGTNGVGKTSIADAYNWGLYGKNSEGKSVIGEIKHRDPESNYEHVHNLQYGVELVFDINGKERTFERIVLEKWGKVGDKRCLTGHEVVYKVDGEKCPTAAAYNKAVNEIAPEDVMRIMTELGYFMSLKDQQKKAYLLRMAYQTESAEEADGMAMQEVLEVRPEFSKFVDEVQGTTLEEHIKRLKKEKASLEEELNAIPQSISDKQETLPQSTEDWSLLQGKIDDIREKISDIDKQLADISSRDAAAREIVNNKKMAISDKRLELSKAEAAIRMAVSQENMKRQQEANAGQSGVNEIKKKISDKKFELNQAESAIKLRINEQELARKSQMNKLVSESNELAEKRQKLIEQSIADNKRLSELAEKRNELLEERKRIKSGAATFTKEELECPTCHRPYDMEVLVQSKLDENLSKGLAVKAEADNLNSEVTLISQQQVPEIDARMNEISQQWGVLNEQAVDVAGTIASDEECVRIRVEIGRLEKSLPTDTPTPIKLINEAVRIENDPTCKALREEIKNMEEDMEEVEIISTQGLEDSKKDLNRQLEALISQKGQKDIIDETKRQIEELKKKQKRVVKDISELEKKIDEIVDFQKAKDEMLLEKINEPFQIVTWKFTGEQMNGVDKLTCTCLVDGMPYNEKNRAGQVNASLDIINAFGRHEGISLPIFIDNAESVVDYIPTDSQKVLLIVDPKCKELKVEI